METPINRVEMAPDVVQRQFSSLATKCRCKQVHCLRRPEHDMPHHPARGAQDYPLIENEAGQKLGSGPLPSRNQ